MDPNAKKVGSVFSFRPASYWSRGQDLNLRPPGYEPGELPDCSTPHRYVAPTSPARSAFKQEKRQERILPVCLNERKSFLSDSQGLHVFHSIESELLTLDGAASLAAHTNTSHALSHPIMLGALLINASLGLLDILLAIAAVTHVVLGIFEREHARLLLANPLLERRLRKQHAHAAHDSE